jgi:hypothetical protein
MTNVDVMNRRRAGVNPTKVMVKIKGYEKLKAR